MFCFSCLMEHITSLFVFSLESFKKEKTEKNVTIDANLESWSQRVKLNEKQNVAQHIIIYKRKRINKIHLFKLWIAHWKGGKDTQSILMCMNGKYYYITQLQKHFTCRSNLGIVNCIEKCSAPFPSSPGCFSFTALTSYFRLFGLNLYSSFWR